MPSPCVCQNLLKWFSDKNYNMPWRETRDPYKIWISEIMLQQTQVVTVKKYYLKWIKTLPTIQHIMVQ